MGDADGAFQRHLQAWYPGISGEVVDSLNCSEYGFNVSWPGDVPRIPPWTTPGLLQTFASDAELEEYIQHSDYGISADRPGMYAAIVLQSGAPAWQYAVRMNVSAVPATQEAVDVLQRGVDLTRLSQYQYTDPWSGLSDAQRAEHLPLAMPGFGALQAAVDKFILNASAPASLATDIATTTAFLGTWGCNLTKAADPAVVHAVASGLLRSARLAPQAVSTVAFPTAAYSESPFYNAVQRVFALLFLLALLFPAFQLIRGMVAEKETRLLEGMRMMGISRSSIYASWLSTYALVFGASAVLITVMTAGSVFKGSNPLLLFLLLALFGCAASALCFVLQAFFSRAKLAAVVGTVLFLGAFFPYYSVNDDTSTPAAKVMASLLAPTALGLSLQTLAALEASGIGLTAVTAHQAVQGFNVASGIAMLAFDSVLYLALGAYFSAVIPGEFGVALPWYFFLSPAWWASAFPSACRCCKLCRCQRCGPGPRSAKPSPTPAAWPAPRGSVQASDTEAYHVLPDDEVESPWSGLGAIAGALASAQGPVATTSTLALQLDDDVGSVGEQHNRLSAAGSTGSDIELTPRLSVAMPMADPLHVALPATVETDHEHGDRALGEDMVVPGGGVAERPNPQLASLADSNRCVQLTGVRKVYDTPDGARVAVDNMHLTMYQGQCLALLGENGAGKSSLIGMITGLLPMTAGVASVFGLDVGSAMSDIRQNMGVCPQHDVLWPELTVEQHLQYFAGVKGLHPKAIPGAVSDILSEVGLTEKAKTQAAALSGGMKRKLSVAIALIGGSKFIVLDEPSSGMDPASRRSLWAVLRSQTDKVLLLTTHYMDEADVCGDRIAVMSAGKLVAVGSSLWLKQRYGVGYNVIITRQPGADTRAITDAVTSQVPGAEALSDVGTELAFRLPTEAAALPGLLRRLEGSAGAALGVQSFGISVTTLEEVFLKIMEDGAAAARSAGAPGQTAAASMTTSHMAAKRAGAKPDGTHAPLFDRARDVPAGRSFFWTHFWAMLLKRARMAMRDRLTMAFQLAIPCAALAAGLLLLKLHPVHDSRALTLDGSGFNPGHTLTQAPASFSWPNNTAGPEHAVPAGTAATLVPYAPGLNPAGADAWLAQLPLGAGAPVPVAGVAGSEPAAEAAAAAWATPNYWEKCFLPNPLVGLPAGLAYLSIDGMAGLQPGTVQNGSAAMAAWLLAHRGAAGGGASTYGSAVPVLFDQPSAGQLSAAAVLLQNSTALYGPALYWNAYTSALLGTLRPGHSITVQTHPLPYTEAQRGFINAAASFVTVLFAVIAFSFIPASFATVVVKERETGSKHQQLISGVSLPSYWAATMVFDYATYIVPCTAAIVMLVAFQVQDLTTADTLPAVVTLFVLYGAATASATYLMSFLFKSHSSAQTVVLLVNVTCVVLLLASFVMQQIPSTCPADRALRYVYRLLPGYSLGNGLLQLSLMDGLKYIDSNCGELSAAQQYAQVFTPWSWDVAGWPVLYMAVSAVVYWALTLLTDILLSQPHVRAALLPDRDRRDAQDAALGDDDVQAEEERVMSGRAEEDQIVVRALRKVYGSGKIAVRGVSFSVPAGSVFGLVGINGAGKSTTFKMLTGDVVPTRGSASIGGFDIQREQLECRRLLGYCPQTTDALFENLTVREHLELFAVIKGVPRGLLDAVVAEKLEQLDLGKYENRCAGQLSGGNKRKLSVAISLIGAPPTVLMDEPSAGCDPVARRFLWEIIATVSRQRKESAIILTSHGMDEVAALSDRVAIMVGGRFRCLNTVAGLQHKYGNGWRLEVKLRPPSHEGVEAVMHELAPYLVEERLPASCLAELAEDLGDRARLDMLHPHGSGALLAQEFTSRGTVESEDFAQWWAAETCVARCHDYIVRAFHGAALLERHGEFLVYSVPPSSQPVSSMFDELETNKERLRISTYSMSQATLESIFNAFAAQQLEEPGGVRGAASVPQQHGASAPSSSPGDSDLHTPLLAL